MEALCRVHQSALLIRAKVVVATEAAVTEAVVTEAAVVVTANKEAVALAEAAALETTDIKHVFYSNATAKARSHTYIHWEATGEWPMIHYRCVYGGEEPKMHHQPTKLTDTLT